METLAQVTAKSSGEPLARVTPVAVTIEVRKPIKGAPLRAHPDIENFTTEAYSLTVKNPEAVGELVYMTHPDVAAAIPSFVRYQRFCFCWDGWQKKPFIWPMDVLLEGARNNNWAVSANRIWQAALKDWACVVPAAGAYALGKPVHPIKGDPPLAYAAICRMDADRISRPLHRGPRTSRGEEAADHHRARVENGATYSGGLRIPCR